MLIIFLQIYADRVKQLVHRNIYLIGSITDLLFAVCVEA